MKPLKHLPLFFFFFLITFEGNTQTFPLKIRGTVQEFSDSTYFIEEAEVLILQGKDTIKRLTTNEKGKFFCEILSQLEKEYRIIVRHKYFVETDLVYTANDFNSELEIILGMIELKINYLNEAVYEHGNSKHFTSFDKDLLKHSTRKLNDYCFEFIYFKTQLEKDKLARKRIKYFKRQLISNGIPKENLKFNPISQELNCEFYPDCKARIQGKVISLEEACGN